METSLFHPSPLVPKISYVKPLMEIAALAVNKHYFLYQRGPVPLFIYAKTLSNCRFIVTSYWRYLVILVSGVPLASATLEDLSK